MKDKNEQARLFMVGYQQGKDFIEAFRTNRIEPKDLKEQVPFLFLMRLQGPTPDFILGRVYESAKDNALKDVLTTSDGLTSDDLQAKLAGNKFIKQNCRFLRPLQ